MKKLSLTIFSVVALVGLATAIVWAAPPYQAADLVFESISFAPEVPYPGQKVVVTISYTNSGSAEVPKDTEVRYQIEIEGIEKPVEEGQFALDEDVPPGKGGEAKITFYALTKEDTYSVTVRMTVDGRETKFGPESLVVETALPPALAQLFAGLGLFAAVMAVMAVGTEVVIESVKFVIGLKQKVTAMEAFDQLKKELPGQLTGLGVDSETMKKVNELFQGLEKTLEPATSMVGVYEKVKDGHFGEAFEALKKVEKLEPGAEAAGQKLKELKEQARVGVQTGFVKLREQLPLSKEVTDPIEAFLLDQIDRVTIETAVNVSETVVKKLQETVLAHEPEWTAAWLRSQVDTFLTRSRDEVMDLVNGDVIKTLEGLGFADEPINKMKSKLNEALNSIEGVAHDKANTYALAVQNLLGAVEEQRNEMQSPVRKIYRRLRDSHLELWKFDIFVIGLVAAIAWLIFAWWPVWPVPEWLGEDANLYVVFFAKLGVAIGAGLVFGLVILLLSALLRRGVHVQVRDGEPPSHSIGYFLRYAFEQRFNSLMGRKEQPPEKYGKVDEKIKEKIGDVGPTTVAKVLLEQEDKHRDEEASRQRVLRVISIIVGTFLAYHLQIDAAEYLGYAVPGIAERINAVNLHKLWSVIPENLTVGIVLTGLAASAGSKFWRDLLGRLQTTREQAEEAARLVRKVKGMIRVEEE